LTPDLERAWANLKAIKGEAADIVRADPNYLSNPRYKAIQGVVERTLPDFEAQARYEGYRRLMGETEARNVADRAWMTPKVRSDISPKLTQDYPDEMQLRPRGAGGAASSSEISQPRMGQSGAAASAPERAVEPAVKDSFGALHSRSIPDFLSANNIPFESASSSSISDRFGPSASNYYNIIDNTGVKKKLRISDHSYGQNNSGDFRYGEPEAIAFEKVLNSAGRDVPDNIAIASADARISQSQSAIDGLNSIIAKGAPFPIGGKSALKDQIRNHSAIISSAQAKKDALVANAAADSEPAVADAASKAINWDRSTVASGWPPMAGSQVVDVPVDAMEKAFQANKSQYVAKPNDAIMDHIAAGMPVSLPEVSASHGALNFQNGRNRFAAARDLGADTVPVSTDDPTALWNVLGKHGAAGSDLHATMLKRASDITLTPVSGNPFEGQ